MGGRAIMDDWHMFSLGFPDGKIPRNRDHEGIFFEKGTDLLGDFLGNLDAFLADKPITVTLLLSGDDNTLPDSVKKYV